jgi:hypothetical protein
MPWATGVIPGPLERIMCLYTTRFEFGPMCRALSPFIFYYPKRYMYSTTFQIHYNVAQTVAECSSKRLDLVLVVKDLILFYAWRLTIVMPTISVIFLDALR